MSIQKKRGKTNDLNDFWIILPLLYTFKIEYVEFYDSKLFKRDLYRYFPELKLDYASEYTKEADYPLLLWYHVSYANR